MTIIQMPQDSSKPPPVAFELILEGMSMASGQYSEKTDLHRWTSDLHMCIQNKSDVVLTYSDTSSSMIEGLAE